MDMDGKGLGTCGNLHICLYDFFTWSLGKSVSKLSMGPLEILWLLGRYSIFEVENYEHLLESLEQLESLWKIEGNR